MVVLPGRIRGTVPEGAAKLPPGVLRRGGGPYSPGPEFCAGASSRISAEPAGARLSRRTFSGRSLHFSPRFFQTRPGAIFLEHPACLFRAIFPARDDHD